MIQVKSNAELNKEADEREASEESPEDIVQLSRVASIVQHQWEINERHYREEFFQRVLAAHRMRAGKYSESKLSEIRATGGSDVYAPLASMQSVSAAASVAQVVVPAGSKAWSLKETPMPTLPQQNRQQIDQHMKAQAQLGGKPGPALEKEKADVESAMFEQIRSAAKKAAQRMETKIHDQLIESGFYQALNELIEDVATYPFAVMKRITTFEKRLSWDGGKVSVNEVAVDKDVRVAPYDFYPSPGMQGVDDGPLIERLRLRDYELSGYRDVKGFIPSEIDEVLQRTQFGMGFNWLNYSMDSERNAAEDNELLNHTSDYGLIDVLRYWGQIRGEMLADYGVEVPDKNAFYDTEIWLIGHNVIRAVVNPHPLAKRPYYKTVWRKVPGQFSGSSPTLQVEHLEQICNAAMRALVNNMGISAGPQIVVFIDQLPSGEEGITAIHPLKVWQMVSKPGHNQPPVQFFQPTSNAKELIGVFQHFWELAGDVTGIYRWNYGADKGMQGAAQTMQGLSMLLENSQKVIRHSVRNIENDVVMRRVYDQFIINMMFDTDDSIKGDVMVDLKGASSLIEKAAERQRRHEMLGVLNGIPEQKLPGLGEIFSKIRLILTREMARDLNLPADLLPSDQELDVLMKQITEQRSKQPPEPRVQAAQISADARLKDQELEMTDHKAQRAHMKEMKSMDLQMAEMQQQGKDKSQFERDKMKLVTDVAKIKQGKERDDREFSLKERGQTGI